MKRASLRISMCVVVVCVLTSSVSADTFGTGDNQFTIEFVNISGDTNPASGYGIVNNDYRMGTYEITNDQWGKFVESVGGTVTGNDGGSYPGEAYDESPDFTGDDVPTNELSWYEGAQFVNYLNTSTGHQAAYKFTGTQGTGDYTFSVWGPADSGYDADNPYRNSEAFYFMPTEDEWVKAAYFNGTTLQEYATKAGESLTQGDGTGGTGWNYWDNGYATDPYGPWDVGSGSEELNGTFDMMGNLWEWMESPHSGVYLSRRGRGFRGGSYHSGDYGLRSSWRGNYGIPYNESTNVGFRIASVPELNEPTIDSIINFIFDSIDANSLQGEGTGNSADNKLNAFISKIEVAAFLIDAGDPNSIIEACEELQSAYKKCDGLKSPKDFVSGDATEELAEMILALKEELDCE